jgi:hypothetical protein
MNAVDSLIVGVLADEGRPAVRGLRIETFVLEFGRHVEIPHRRLVVAILGMGGRAHHDPGQRQQGENSKVPAYGTARSPGHILISLL